MGTGLSWFQNTEKVRALRLGLFSTFLGLMAFSMASLATERPLSVAFEPLDLQLTKVQKQKLTGILSSALEIDVVFVPSHYADEPDIVLSNSLVLPETRYRAHYTIDKIPEFIAVSYGTVKDSPLVGLNSGAYKLIERDYYPVEDVDTAVNMLSSGRLSRVIDVRDNEFYYRLKSDAFKFQVVRPVSYLYVDFKDEKLATQYDKKVLQFSNLTDVVKAKPKDINSKQLTLIRLGKTYDDKKQRLVAAEDEVAASFWFKKHLTDFDITIEDTNSMTTIEKLRRGEQLCALNVRKNKERAAVGSFTLPSRVFLSMKLFVKRGLPQFDELTRLQMRNKVIDLADFLSRHPDGLVALPQGYKRYNSLSGSLKNYLAANLSRVVTVKRQDNLKGLQLLRQNRVDYLVEFPTTIKSYMGEFADLDQYDSFEISRDAQVTPTHIICSKNETGDAAVGAINQLLQDPLKRAELITIYTDGLTGSDVSRFRQAFESAVKSTDL